MADESHNENEGQEVDPLQNLKSEFSRKLENTSKKFESIESANQQLQAQLQQLTEAVLSKPQRAEESNDEIPDPTYEPEKYAKWVASGAVKAAQETQQQSQRQQQEIANAWGELTELFPQLANQKSDFYKSADKIFNGMEPTAANMQKAVLQTARSLGVRPGSNDEDESMSDDEFTGSSNRSRSKSHKMRTKSGAGEELDEKTLAFAQMVGLNINDPKQVERLKKASKRKNWYKYSKPGGED